MIIKLLNYFDYYKIRILDIYKICFNVYDVKNNKFAIILNVIFFLLDKKITLHFDEISSENKIVNYFIRFCRHNNQIRLNIACCFY